MKWNKISDKIPQPYCEIVAIMGGRFEQCGDQVESAEIVMLRCDYLDDIRTMDCTKRYYLPGQGGDYYETIEYWVTLEEFGFPDEMICKPKGYAQEDKEINAHVRK